MILRFNVDEIDNLARLDVFEDLALDKIRFDAVVRDMHCNFIEIEWYVFGEN